MPRDTLIWIHVPPRPMSSTASAISPRNLMLSACKAPMSESWRCISSSPPTTSCATPIHAPISWSAA